MFKVIQVSWSLDMQSCLKNITDAIFFASVFAVACSSLHWKCRPVFTCYSEVRCQQQTPDLPASWSCWLASSPWFPLELLGKLQTVCAHMHIPPQELQATVNSENMASVTFFHNGSAYRGFSTLGLLWTSSMETFYGLIMCVFSNIWNLVTIHFNCLGNYCKAFFLWNSSSILWTKKLQQTFHAHEGEWIISQLLCLSELSL